MKKSFLLLFTFILSIFSEEILKESFEYEPGMIFSKNTNRKLVPKWSESVSNKDRSRWNLTSASALSIDANQRLTSAESSASWMTIGLPSLIDKKMIKISLKVQIGDAKGNKNNPGVSFGLSAKNAPFDISRKNAADGAQFFYMFNSFKGPEGHELFHYKVLAGVSESEINKKISHRNFHMNLEGDLLQIQMNLKDRTYTATFNDEEFDVANIPAEIQSENLAYFIIQFSDPVPQSEEDCTWVDDLTIFTE